MYKEIIICIVIVITVLGLDTFVQKHTTNNVDYMKSNLTSLRDDIKETNHNTEEINNKMNEINDNWKDRRDKLAYYIEHDELEKVDTHLVLLKSNIEIGEYDKGLEELDVCSYVLEHIQDKQSFKLKNIF